MKALAIFCAEGLSFLAAAINIRACAKGRLAVTLGTDALIAGMNFMLVVWIVELHTWPARIAYVAGAVAGSALGMRITNHWREGERER